MSVWQRKYQAGASTKRSSGSSKTGASFFIRGAPCFGGRAASEGRRRKRGWLRLALAASLGMCFIGRAIPATANAQVTPGSKGLGHVHFLNSCDNYDQVYLNSGVAALYSFWFSVAHDLFKRAEAQDPDCMIAYWGEAMSDYVQIEAGGLPEGQ